MAGFHNTGSVLDDIEFNRKHRHKSGGGKDDKKSLSNKQQSIFDLMKDTLRKWGLSALVPDLRKLVVAGDTDSAELALALSQTKAYKIRFAANEARIKAGLPELSPAKYIALEESYRSVGRQYDIPSDFLDKSLTDRLIASDVNPPEFLDRVQARADLVYNSPPEALQEFNKWYAGGKGGAIAALLDPDRSEQLLLKQVNAAQIGGAAAASGLNANRATSERLAGEGVTLAQARQAYADISQRVSADTSIGNRFGTDLGQSVEEAAVFESDAEATHKLDTAYAEEQSLFGGHGGGTTASGDKGANY